MKINKILHCNYNISQQNSVMVGGSICTFIINIRYIFEFVEDHLYVNDDYLLNQRKIISNESRIYKFNESDEFDYNFILGSREFAFSDNKTYEHYAENKNNSKMNVKEFMIKRLLE